MNVSMRTIRLSFAARVTAVAAVLACLTCASAKDPVPAEIASLRSKLNSDNPALRQEGKDIINADYLTSTDPVIVGIGNALLKEADRPGSTTPSTDPSPSGDPSVGPSTDPVTPPSNDGGADAGGDSVAVPSNGGQAVPPAGDDGSAASPSVDPTTDPFIASVVGTDPSSGGDVKTPPSDGGPGTPPPGDDGSAPPPAEKPPADPFNASVPSTDPPSGGDVKAPPSNVGSAPPQSDSSSLPSVLKSLGKSKGVLAPPPDKVIQADPPAAFADPFKLALDPNALPDPPFDVSPGSK